MPVTLRLILGDQLNSRHRWFTEPHEDIVYVLMEIRQETNYVLHHAQKILAIFAAMRDFARALRESGHRVHYLAIDDPANRHTLPDNLDMLLAHYRARRFEYQAPDEWRLDAQLLAYCNALASAGMVSTQKTDTEHFYTARDEATLIFTGREHWLMDHFYRRLRIKHQVLLDNHGKPAGGKWNYDRDNRKAWRGLPRAPKDFRARHDHSALWQTIVACGVKSFGNPSAADLAWPLNRGEALRQLDAFVEHALPHFGDFQDAMNTDQERLFHSLLSFALNTKMLSPREVVDKAEAAYRAGHAPLAAAEGFIRQILGWREYVRGIYWAHMPGYVERNVFEHHLALPEWFWTGNTRMRCLAHAIGQSLNGAYAHHIQRLMIIGNFALLAGLKPQAVHRWYLGVYADAFEWVELPNTLGMSQFADGGLLATKPYVSSAAYIDRMSDYCGNCHYDKKARLGERACPFNAMYWDFLNRNRGKLTRNPRLGVIYRQLDRMDADQRDALTRRAEQLRQNLDGL